MSVHTDCVAPAGFLGGCFGVYGHTSCEALYWAKTETSFDSGGIFGHTSGLTDRAG